MGPIVGSVSVLIVNELLRSLQNYQMFIYGILLLIVIVLIPGGLYGEISNFVNNLRDRSNNRKGVETNVKS